MTARSIAVAVALALAPAAFADKPKEGTKKLKSAMGALDGLDVNTTSDDPKLAEIGTAIDAAAADNDPEAAGLLMQLMQGTYKSAGVEVFVSEKARAALTTMTSAEARDEVRKALEKTKKAPKQFPLLADVVAGWPDEASAAALASFLGEKDEMLVTMAARGLGALRRKEGVRPLINVFDAWKEKGGEPIEAIGGALLKITGQGFSLQADWAKWWDGEEANFDPAKQAAGGEGTRTRNFQPQAPPTLFRGLELTSRKVLIILDISGSMHIRQYVHDPIDEVIPPKPKGEGTQTRDPPKGDTQTGKDGKPLDPNDPAAGGAGGRGPSKDKGPPLPPGVNPDDPKYKKKFCTYAQCSARREAKCPSDENLPDYYTRLKRLIRQVVTAVKNMDEATKFNFICFSTDAKSWKPKGLVPANPKNKEDAVKWLESLQYSGPTAAEKALDMAFETFWEADSIVFVTDGAPTDSAGKPTIDTAKVTGHDLADPKHWRPLLDDVKRRNKSKKVRIDVITIAEGHTGFAVGLAAENGGKYLQVP